MIMLASGGIDITVLAVVMIVATLAGLFLSWTIRDFRVWNRTQNEALQRVNAELEARYKDLEAFSFSVAHDLKTPIATILGYSYLLREHYGEAAGNPVDVAEEIEGAAIKMSEIIDSILTLANVGIRQVELQPLRTDVILRNVEKRLERELDAANGIIEKPSEWPAALGYDPWVEEVWVNYVSNGIKYGGSPPRLVLKAEPDGEFVRFSVCDNGAGIAPEDHRRLFTEFTRLEKGRTEGHGLGLAIVRRVLEKLGGEYGVESVPGKGSTFYFKLPAV
jgi:signal transduction histidine kinase